MTDQVQSQSVETQVQELTLGELEHVSGGAHSGGMNILLADGSVRNLSGSDLAVWQTNYGRSPP